MRSALAEADTLAQSNYELKSCLTKQLTRVQLRFCDLFSFVRDFKITFSQEYVLTFFERNKDNYPLFLSTLLATSSLQLTISYSAKELHDSTCRRTAQSAENSTIFDKYGLTARSNNWLIRHIASAELITSLLAQDQSDMHETKGKNNHLMNLHVKREKNQQKYIVDTIL